MTNLEALRATVNFPIDDAKLKKILIDAGLSELKDYTGVTKQFELATAALYVLVVTSANVSEGDYSVSLAEKEDYRILANGIYAKYGIQSPFSASKTIRNRSHYW